MLASILPALCRTPRYTVTAARAISSRLLDGGSAMQSSRRIDRLLATDGQAFCLRLHRIVRGLGLAPSVPMAGLALDSDALLASVTVRLTDSQANALRQRLVDELGPGTTRVERTTTKNRNQP